MILLFGACEKEPPAPPPPPADGPTVPTLLGEVKGVVFTGEWTSGACGGRGYPRNLLITEENEYAGLDLVSPCPKDAKCAWSGMLAFAGTWVQQGTDVHLRELGGPIQSGGPHPTRIQATKDGRIVENDCIYDRGLTVPEDYMEVEVRPRIPGK